MKKRLSKLMLVPKLSSFLDKKTEEGNQQDGGVTRTSSLSNLFVSLSPKPSSVENTTKEESKLAKLFETLNPTEETLGQEGLVQLWEQLGMKDGDIEILIVLYKLDCKSLMDISKSEFIEGFQSLQLSDLKSFKSMIPRFTSDIINDEEAFRGFYKYLFQACRDGTIKSIPKGHVTYLLPIVFSKLSTRHQKYAKLFCEFLETQTAIESIKNDEWMNFLTFCTKILDFKDYDDSGGHWPLLFDSFVEWAKQKN